MSWDSRTAWDRRIRLDRVVMGQPESAGQQDREPDSAGQKDEQRTGVGVFMGQPDSAGQKDEHRTRLSWDSRTARDRRMNNGQGCHGTAGQRGTEG